MHRSHNLHIYKGTPGQPKYRQIVNSVIKSLEDKHIQPGDRLPSSNQFCGIFHVARDTVIKAINELKSLGVITSRPGKGYYLSHSEPQRRRNVFLLFDSFNSFKEDLYNSFLYHIGENINTDIFFHHMNQRVFQRTIDDNSGLYTDYVIMPTTEKETAEILHSLDQYGNVFILDQGIDEFGNQFPSVCQDFKNGIYASLISGLQRIRKYQSVSLVITIHQNQSSKNICAHIIDGFKAFCHESGLASNILSSVNEEVILPGTCYFVHEDTELEKLVLTTRRKGLIPGRDIGIISFNETPLKKIVANGIATISVDYAKYGFLLADMVLNNRKEHLINEMKLILRDSL